MKKLSTFNPREYLKKVHNFDTTQYDVAEEKFNKFRALIAIVFLLVIILAVYTFRTLMARTKTIHVKAIVLSHNVTADRYGSRTYTTIVKDVNGTIREMEGLYYYSLPLYSETTITYKELQ